MTKTVSVTISGSDEELLPLFAFLTGRTVVSVDEDEGLYEIIGDASDDDVERVARVMKTESLVERAGSRPLKVSLSREVEDHSPAERAADKAIPDDPDGVLDGPADGVSMEAAKAFGANLAAKDRAAAAEKAEAKKSADKERKRVKRAEAKAAKEAAEVTTAEEATADLLGHDKPEASGISIGAMNAAVRAAVDRIGKDKAHPAIRALYDTYGAKVMSDIDESDYAELLDQLGDL